MKAPVKYQYPAALIQVADYYVRHYGLGFSGDGSLPADSVRELEGWQIITENGSPLKIEAIEKNPATYDVQVLTAIQKANMLIDIWFPGARKGSRSLRQQ